MYSHGVHQGGSRTGALLRVNEGMRPWAQAGGEQVGNSCSSSLSSCYCGPSPHKGFFVRAAKAQSTKRGEVFPSLLLLEV